MYNVMKHGMMCAEGMMMDENPFTDHLPADIFSLVKQMIMFVEVLQFLWCQNNYNRI